MVASGLLATGLSPQAPSWSDALLEGAVAFVLSMPFALADGLEAAT